MSLMSHFKAKMHQIRFRLSLRWSLPLYWRNIKR